MKNIEEIKELLSQFEIDERYKLINELYKKGLGFGHPLTLEEISNILQIPKEKVRMIESTAIRKMRYIINHFKKFKDLKYEEF